jgi:phosphonate transport system substrate-binding protein
MNRSTRHSGHDEGKTSVLVLIIAFLIAAAAVTYAVINRTQYTGPNERRIAEQDELIMRLTGLANQHTTNGLAKDYADADGDLVADAPADAAKQIDPAELTFSYVAADDQEPFKKAFAELMTAIGTATGKPVKYVPYETTEQQVAALREGKLHVVGFSTGSVPMAVCLGGFVPAVMMAGADGQAGYQLEIITPAGSDIRTIEDLRGRDLAVTEPTSNSGFKAPLVTLREKGLLMPKDYRIRYSFGYSQSIDGIKNKQFDAAAVANDVLRREINAGRISPGEFRSVYVSDRTFPTAALGTPHNLKPELADKIKQAMLQFDWKNTGLASNFGEEGKAKFVPVDYKKDWAFVRQVDDSLGAVYELK